MCNKLGMHLEHLCSQVWRLCTKLCIGALFLLTSMASYTQQTSYTIRLQNNAFYPEEIVVPANTKIQLIIENMDDEPEEFDSFDLNREKVIFPKRKVRLFIGPLLPGEYEYFGEFHPDTARGRVIVRDTSAKQEPSNKQGDSNVN
jgi:hypothetical protein